MFATPSFPRVPFLNAQDDHTDQTPVPADSTPPAIPFDALVQAAENAKCAQDNSKSSILLKYEAIAKTIEDEDAQHMFAALVFLSTRDNVTRRGKRGD